ncbi:MAG: ribose 5-phosphate isomerase B [Bacteroidetes bacterium]|nr:ribose 5-phosphate isomerase B [Bacteroidota bacterium]
MLDSLKKIAIGSDHAGYKLKEYLKEYLQKQKFIIKDFGTFSEERMDYPDPIHPLADAVNKNEFERGIIICGSGNGVAIVANKYRMVRAAVCWSEEITKLARQHNDANIISLPARFLTPEQGLRYLQVFLDTEFERGRHLRRVEKISQII